MVSVAIGRPLHPVILRLLGPGDPRYTDIANRAQHRASMVITTVLGLTLLAHAAAVAVLALTQSTSTFVALQHPVGLPIFGLRRGPVPLPTSPASPPAHGGHTGMTDSESRKRSWSRWAGRWSGSPWYSCSAR